MAYDSRVYRILIASPSDVEEEREIAVRVIQEWNDLYSYTRKVTLLPLRWETHAAPEYGTRPQEVINRTIVDQCDLLVGVFWTRIGSPTGEADSGTLEEIERVGNAEKPIMLYFSKVGIDPDTLDLNQIERLKDFKAKTYPKGLVESYKSIIEFRDKFAKQLELKIRDLQRSEATGEAPLSLEFLSTDGGELLGSDTSVTIDRPIVKDFNEVPEDKRDLITRTVESDIEKNAALPIALAIDNSSSSGVRNLYIELYLRTSSDDAILSESQTAEEKHKLGGSWVTRLFVRQFERATDSKLARFDSDQLQKIEDGWKLAIDWEALQPQRTRLIKPILYLHSRTSTTVHIRAKIFADSFPEPMNLKSKLQVTVNEKESSLSDLLPEWLELIQEDES